MVLAGEPPDWPGTIAAMVVRSLGSKMYLPRLLRRF